MTPLSSNLPARRSERGGVTWVTALMIVGTLLAAWLGVTWAPVYWVHYEVKQTVRAVINQAIKDKEDALLVKSLCDKLATLDTVDVEGADGSTAQGPAIVVNPADVTWERDSSSTPPALHVAFEYTRQVRYPFLKQAKEWTGRVDMTGDLSIPKW
jgi:hypothetical protein